MSMRSKWQTFWDHYALRRFRQSQGIDSGSRLTALLLAWRWVFIVAMLSLISCGDTPCGCPFGTVCQPDYSKPEMYRCIPAPRNSEATDVPAST